MARSLRAHLETPRQQAMYGVVHGGTDQAMRRESAEYLASLPFDGFAIGGSLGKSARAASSRANATPRATPRATLHAR